MLHVCCIHSSNICCYCAADNMLRKQAAMDCSSTASAGGQSLAETSVEEHGQLERLRALSTAVSQAALAELNIQQAIDDLLAELGKVRLDTSCTTC